MLQIEVKNGHIPAEWIKQEDVVQCYNGTEGQVLNVLTNSIEVTNGYSIFNILLVDVKSLMRLI
jgi:hypothetical protein